jgi:nitroimidazol reductase NimA-like FMN-containing flavoprotein (pyridoxamine 5'-phosphate oxidase superfamily)
MSADRSNSGALSEGDALALLATVPVGRLVYSDRALPFVTPVNFILDGSDVVIRAGRRSPLATHTPGNVVAFEADEISVVDRSGWSVVVTGRVQLIDDVDEIARLDAWHLQTWRPATTDRYLRLHAELISGQYLPIADSHSTFALPLRRVADARS